MSTTDLTRLSIADMADLELLHVIDDNTGKPSSHIAEILEKDKSCVGQRLSWMKRKGLIEMDNRGGWKLSRRGRALFNGRHDTMLQIRAISRSVAGDGVMNWVARREWARNL